MPTTTEVFQAILKRWGVETKEVEIYPGTTRSVLMCDGQQLFARWSFITTNEYLKNEPALNMETEVAAAVLFEVAQEVAAIRAPKRKIVKCENCHCPNSMTLESLPPQEVCANCSTPWPE